MTGQTNRSMIELEETNVTASKFDVPNAFQTQPFEKIIPTYHLDASRPTYLELTNHRRHHQRRRRN